MPPGLGREILSQTLEHLVLVLISMSVAIAIGLPLGILITRRAIARRWVLGSVARRVVGITCTPLLLVNSAFG